VQVYWSLDARAWMGDYTTTRTDQSGLDANEDRNAAAHAVLGSFGVSTNDIHWSVGPEAQGGPESLLAWRAVGPWRLPIVLVSDTRMMAEQSEVLRRAVHVDPDYVVPRQPMEEAEATQIAHAVLACDAQGGGTQFQLNATTTRALVHAGNLAYWFYPEPVAGWQTAPCSYADAGRVHLAIDAVTGTVLSSRLRCES